MEIKRYSMNEDYQLVESAEGHLAMLPYSDLAQLQERTMELVGAKASISQLNVIQQSLEQQLKAAREELATAEQRAFDLEAKLVVMGEALKVSERALNDWLHSYAREHCDEDKVKETYERLRERGTVAYIADCLEIVRTKNLPARVTALTELARICVVIKDHLEAGGGKFTSTHLHNLLVAVRAYLKGGE